ncbi:MAG: hypothetical protein FJ278_07910, partial [Planctomycetes bacterium]|nr:hypothetical protein [Planctomycetota bacterium]
MLPRQMASALLSFGLIFCLWSAAFAAEPAFTFADGVLTIRTERYEVAWRDGCMVRLRSVLPQAGEFTLPTMPMAAGQLPNGLGSFHGQDKEGKEQHFPWRFAPLSTAFPAQHPPAAETKVAFEKSGNTARLTYSGLKDEPSASLVQELAVEAGTGDLVIRQEGRSANPGVFGVAFSALNLRPDVQFLVPYFGGQRWGKEFAAEKLVTIAWPEFW